MAKLSDFGIKPRGDGVQWTQTCPECSHLRKAHNRTKRCLFVMTGPQSTKSGSLNRGEALFKCFNCPFKGHADERDPETRSRAKRFERSSDRVPRGPWVQRGAMRTSRAHKRPRSQWT